MRICCHTNHINNCLFHCIMYYSKMIGLCLWNGNTNGSLYLSCSLILKTFLIFDEDHMDSEYIYFVGGQLWQELWDFSAQIKSWRFDHCDDCRKDYRNKDYLREHVRTVHGGMNNCIYILYRDGGLNICIFILIYIYIVYTL